MRSLELERVGEYSQGLIGSLKTYLCRFALIPVLRNSDQLSVLDMQSHPFHCLEREFIKENFLMLEVSLVMRLKWSFHLCEGLLTVCIFWSLWQAVMHRFWLTGFPALIIAAETSGDSVLGIWKAAQCQPWKNRSLELWSLFHTSAFLVSSDAHQLSLIKYAQQCYCTAQWCCVDKSVNI